MNHFRGARYTPTFFSNKVKPLSSVHMPSCQLFSDLGYKGIVMLHPQMDVVDKNHLDHC
jgi:hypothetical protein